MINMMISNSSNVDDEPELADGRLVCVPDHLFGSHLNHYHPDDPFLFSSCFDHTFIIIIHMIFPSFLSCIDHRFIIVIRMILFLFSIQDKT